MSLGLVDYSSSSSDEESFDEHEKIEKCANVPAKPLPSKLPNPFKSAEKTVEDTSNEHNGRIRSFPHERGIWATYVYIQCPKTELVGKLQTDLLGEIKSDAAFDSIDLWPFDDLHMSLTRTLVLQHHWIDEFVRTIDARIKLVKRFEIHFDSIKVYCNDDKTRTFVSLALAEKDSIGNRFLCDVVKRLNDSLSEFNLPPFYEEASFHVSLLWCLGDLRDELQRLLPKLRSHLEQLLANDLSQFIVNVDQLHCKVGNKFFVFRLL